MANSLVFTYAKAYTEVLEIIKFFPEEDKNKIPKEDIEFFEKNSDKDYYFEINPEIDLSEQNISKKANAIIILLYKKYFASEKQKQILNRILRENEQKLEQKKKEIYDVDIFKSNNKNKDLKIDDEIKNNQLIVVNEKSFFRNILDRIKKLFKIK